MRRNYLFIVVLLLIGGTSFSQEEINFVYTSYLPANYLDTSGRHTGFFVDIIKEALQERMNIPVSMDIYPWPRCQAMVKLGQADIMATIPTPDRREYAIVVETPLWVKYYNVFTVAGHPRIADMNTIRSVDDLKRSGLVVLTYSGDGGTKVNIENAGVPVIFASSVEGMYKMLFAGRADLIIEDAFLVKPLLEELGYSHKVYKTTGIIQESPFCLMISKKSSYGSMATRIDSTIKAMWADGTIERIMLKYR